MGLQVKIWDPSVKCSYAAVKFLNAYISIVSLQNKTKKKKKKKKKKNTHI